LSLVGEATQRTRLTSSRVENKRRLARQSTPRSAILGGRRQPGYGLRAAPERDAGKLFTHCAGENHWYGDNLLQDS
jgi:hypothetical protein